VRAKSCHGTVLFSHGFHQRPNRSPRWSESSPENSKDGELRPCNRTRSMPTQDSNQYRGSFDRTPELPRLAKPRYGQVAPFTDGCGGGLL